MLEFTGLYVVPQNIADHLVTRNKSLQKDLSTLTYDITFEVDLDLWHYDITFEVDLAIAVSVGLFDHIEDFFLADFLPDVHHDVP